MTDRTARCDRHLGLGLYRHVRGSWDSMLGECQTHDLKVASSNPGMSSRDMFSRVQQAEEGLQMVQGKQLLLAHCLGGVASFLLV